MLKPAAQTYNTFRISQQHLPSFTQALFDFRGDSGCMKKDTASHLGVIPIEAISDDVNGRDAGADVIGVYGNTSNLPAVLYFKAQLVSGVFDASLTAFSRSRLLVPISSISSM